MRAREFLIEQVSAGWQPQTIINYGGNLGNIVIGHRLNDELVIVEAMFLYYNKLLSTRNAAYGLRWKNNNLYEWDILTHVKGTLINSNTSIEKEHRFSV
jgi:hypothetical protein